MMETQTQNTASDREIVTREFAAIIVDYVTRINSRYRGNEFTSSQLAKNIMTTTELEKTRFPIVHRIVREILRKWEEQALCTHIARTKYSRCRRTKDTYRFNERGLNEIKKRAIDETIETIKKSELRSTPIMRTRELIIKDKLEELLDSVMRTPQPAEIKET